MEEIIDFVFGVVEESSQRKYDLNGILKNDLKLDRNVKMNFQNTGPHR